MQNKYGLADRIPKVETPRALSGRMSDTIVEFEEGIGTSEVTGWLRGVKPFKYQDQDERFHEIFEGPERGFILRIVQARGSLPDNPFYGTIVNPRSYVGQMVTLKTIQQHRQPGFIIQSLYDHEGNIIAAGRATTPVNHC